LRPGILTEKWIAFSFFFSFLDQVEKKTSISKAYHQGMALSTTSTSHGHFDNRPLRNQKIHRTIHHPEEIFGYPGNAVDTSPYLNVATGVGV